MAAVIVIAILAGLLALALAVLYIPVDMVVSLERYGGFRTRVRVSWLFGLVHKELSGEKKLKAKKKRKQRQSIRDTIDIIKTRGFLKRTALLLKQVVKSLKIKNFSAFFRIGLDDAADTGILFAICGPAVSLLDYYTDCSIRLEPSFFDEAVFEGYLNGTVRLQPIRLVPPFSRFIFSRPTMRVIKTMMVSRWRKKK